MEEQTGVHHSIIQLREILSLYICGLKINLVCSGSSSSNSSSSSSSLLKLAVVSVLRCSPGGGVPQCYVGWVMVTVKHNIITYLQKLLYNTLNYRPVTLTSVCCKTMDSINSCPGIVMLPTVLMITLL